MIFRGDNQGEHDPVPSKGQFGHVDEWGQLAVDYLDGRLAPEDKARVETHLRGCQDCRERLHYQQAVVSFLHDTELDDPPADMEDRVLGELLFPTKQAARPFGVAAEEPQQTVWRRKIRPWVPAGVAVAALLVAVVAFGLLSPWSSNKSGSPEGTTVAAASKEAADTSIGEATLSVTSTTTAGATTTSALTAPETTAATMAPVPSTVVGKKDIVRALRDAAASTAYIAFATDASGGRSDGQTDSTVVPGTDASPTTTGTTAVTISSAKVDDTVYQIEAFTQMAPLDESLWLGGPTFAAYVSLKDVEALVDLLQSMGASVSLNVSLAKEPRAMEADVAALLLEHSEEFPALVAEKIPAPAISRWTFVTSTTSPPGGQVEDGTLPPSGDGDRILLVLIVRR